MDRHNAALAAECDADWALDLSAAEVVGSTVFKSRFTSIDSDRSGEVCQT